MRFFEVIIQLAIAFACIAADEIKSQITLLVGIDFIKDGLDTKIPIIYKKIKSSVAYLQPFSLTVGKKMFIISNLTLTEFEYHSDDIRVIVPSKENFLSIELSKAIHNYNLASELMLSGKITRQKKIQFGTPKNFMVKLRIKALADILISPNPQAIQVSLQTLKITHKILDVKVEGHLSITEMLKLSNLISGEIDKIIDKRAEQLANNIISKLLDLINSEGIPIKQLASHDLRIGTDGLHYPDSQKEISIKLLLSFTKKQSTNALAHLSNSNEEMKYDIEDNLYKLDFLPNPSETLEIKLLNSIISSNFPISKHITVEINQELINTITDVIFDEGLMNAFHLNNEILDKISNGEDTHFNLNTKFFQMSLPCLAYYSNKNFTVAITALSRPVSRIANENDQQLITISLELNVKFLLDKDPKIVLLDINMNTEAGLLLLPVIEPQTTIYLGAAPIYISKTELVQKCEALTGDDIASELVPILAIVQKVLDEAFQSGFTLRQDILRPLSITNIILTTRNGILNIEALADFIE